MPRIEDTVKFPIPGGRVVSGRVKNIQVTGATRGGCAIFEILLLRNKIYETFVVLEENIEVIAYGNR